MIAALNYQQGKVSWRKHGRCLLEKTLLKAVISTCNIWNHLVLLVTGLPLSLGPTTMLRSRVPVPCEYCRLWRKIRSLRLLCLNHSIILPVRGLIHCQKSEWLYIDIPRLAAVVWDHHPCRLNTPADISRIRLLDILGWASRKLYKYVFTMHFYVLHGYILDSTTWAPSLF